MRHNQSKVFIRTPLKSEFYHLNKFESIEDLKHGIDAYIRYYNEERIKLKLGMSPVAFRRQQEVR